METVQLILFTVIWICIWVFPLKPLPRTFEIIAGLIPFCAFSLRVFAGFFVTVPHGDPVGDCVRPLTDWVLGAGSPSYQLVLDGTIAVGLLWFAQAFHIPWHSRLATSWIFAAVAAASIATLSLTGLPLQEYIATKVPTPVLALALALVLSAILWWTPGPHSIATRRTAAIALISIIPIAVIILVLVTPFIVSVPHDQQAQARSLLTLGTGSISAFVGYQFNPFQANRSRLLFALVVGVAVGAVGALYFSTIAIEPIPFNELLAVVN